MRKRMTYEVQWCFLLRVLRGSYPWPVKTRFGGRKLTHVVLLRKAGDLFAAVVTRAEKHSFPRARARAARVSLSICFCFLWVPVVFH